jgi:colanic acid biosynthesis protein WcaH
VSLFHRLLREAFSYEVLNDDTRCHYRLLPAVTRNKVLLGLRNNEPAEGFFFVPGGIILKNERLREAFARILKKETSCAASVDEVRLLGVFEHFYSNNRFGEPGYGTHYIVLAYELKLDDASGLKVDAQHSEYCWWDEIDLLVSERVHEHTKAYFR